MFLKGRVLQNRFDWQKRLGPVPRTQKEPIGEERTHCARILRQARILALSFFKTSNQNNDVLKAQSLIVVVPAVGVVSARTVFAWQQAGLSDPWSKRRQPATSSLPKRLLIQPQHGTEPQRRNERLL